MRTLNSPVGFTIVFLCLLSAGAQAQPQENLVIEPGADLFKSPPGLNSEYDLGECMIPVAYFEAGTPQLTGCELPLVPKDPEDPEGPQSFLLKLQGVPLDTYLEFDVGTVDTIVRRLEPLDFGAGPEDDVTVSTPIELVALKLISADPIEITCDQGVTRWIAEVDVDEETGPSSGEMSVTLDHPALIGGSASSTLSICPRVTFTRIDPGTSGTFDVYPCDMFCGPELLGETTWSFASPDPENALKVEGLTTENFFFTELLTAEEAKAVAVPKTAGVCNPDCPCVFKYPHLSANHKHQACLPCPCDVDQEEPDVHPPPPQTIECAQQGGTSRFATCIAPGPGAGTLCIEDWLDSVMCFDQPGNDPDKISTCMASGPPSFFEAGCDPGKETEVTFLGIDECCNDHTEVSSTFVQDTLPPVVTPGGDDLYCMWPANHEYVCFDKTQFDPDINDICHDYDWKFVGCASDQPANGTGDGDTVNDCQVTCGGDVICVRAERQNNDPDGRRYAVEIQATDECNNVGAPEVIGYLHVPHSSLSGCVAPPEIHARCDASPTSGDASLQVSFTDNSTSSGPVINSWDWEFGDGGTSDVQNPTHVYTAAGVFTPTLTVSTDPPGGCNPSAGLSATTTCPQVTVTEPGTFDCSLPDWDGPQNNGDPIEIDIAAELGLTGIVQILSIRQDEEIKVNNGDNCPDAQINGGIATVNAERLGGGDGRFYHIDFTVDGVNVCGAEGLTICIPRGSSCVDGGALFDSTGPCD